MLNLLVPIAAVGLLLLAGKKRKPERVTSEVGGLLPPPSPYVFAWWVRKPGTGYVFSGWQGPKEMSWQAMNSRMIQLGREKQFVTALRWNGTAWENPP